MINNNRSASEISSARYQEFSQEDNEQKYRKKASKKKVFIGIMILCLPLFLSFTYIMLHKTHNIHYPTLSEAVNPYIYQYMNGTVAFMDTQGQIRVYDNRKNQLNSIGNYMIKYNNTKFLMSSSEYQMIMSINDTAQIKWKKTNEVLNLVQIDSIQYLDDLELQNCNPKQSYPLVENIYLFNCNKQLYAYDAKNQVKCAQFTDFNSEGVVFAQQTSITNVFNIIFTSKTNTNPQNDIISIYEYDLRDIDTQANLKLLYQGENKDQPLNDIIIQLDNIIFISSQSIANYQKTPPSVQGLSFGLQKIDSQSLSMPEADIKQCFDMRNNIMICYDNASKSLIQLKQYQIENTLVLNEQMNINWIKQGQEDDLFILSVDQLLRITVNNSLSISETYNFKQNGINEQINDMIVLKY